MHRSSLTVGFAVLLVAGCGQGTPDADKSVGGQDDSSAPTLAPVDSVSPTISVATAPVPTTAPPATEPTTSVAVTSTTNPDENVDQDDTQGFTDVLAGLDWELSGIERTCADGNAGRLGCTRVVHDPSGVPISLDESSRTLRRHVREDGVFVEAVLPESYGPYVWLVAAGPDEVVYLNVTNEPGPEGSADLVAVTLAPGDAGREVGRAVGAGNSGTDADLVVTAGGVVTTDWYGSGQRPAADRTPVMRWVDRVPDDDDSPDPGADAFPNGVDSITIDAYEHTVTVNGRVWQLTGQAAEFPPTGMPSIVATFDGGFIARYDEVVNDYRSIVVRGWPDGSVDEWLVPGSGLDGPELTIVPEPMGTLLISNGNTFARAEPFEGPPPAWEGRLNIDVETGDVDATALNEHLGAVDWTATKTPWDIDPVAFANAATGPLSSPAELRTITHVEQAGGTAIVTVTDERFLDDSVYATQLTFTINENLRSVETIEWANSCQPERGHQTFEAAYCV